MERTSTPTTEKFPPNSGVLQTLTLDSTNARALGPVPLELRMTWEFGDFERAAEELLARTKSYEWAFRILRQAQVYGEHFAHRREQLLKRFVSRRKPYFVFYTSDGLRLMGDYRDRYSRHAALYPDDETDLANMLVAALDARPGILIDVGANMGIVTAGVAKRRPDRRIIAIEAEPGTAKRAAATFGMNGLKNVTLLQAAASDKDGETTFYSPRGKSESASLVELEGKKVRKITVPAVKLDSIDLKGQTVSCLKFDVEGFEPSAIKGSIELIKKHRPTVVYEYHWDIAPRLGWTVDDVAQILAECGPYRFEVWDGGTGTLPYPPNRKDGAVANIIARPEQLA